MFGGIRETHERGTYTAARRAVRRAALPAVLALGISATALTSSYGDTGEDGSPGTGGAGNRPAATAALADRQAAADFPTWGTRWVVHSTPELSSPATGMINSSVDGADRIRADHQVDTGRQVCEGDACSTYMAHITAPVEGFLSVVAVDIPESSLPGVPVREAPAPGAPSGTRAEALRRAAGWLTADNGAQVPYSQSRNWSDGYRQDCSGYVSMALNLGGPGPNTVGLTGAQYTRPISVAELQPGDLLIDAAGDSNTRHVVMFEKWDDEAHTSYTAYEQRGGHGTDHRSLTYGLDGGEFKPYRPVTYTD